MIKALLTLVAALWLALPAQAQGLPEWVDPYLNDLTGVLTDAQAGEIRDALRAADSDPGVEMTAVIIGRRADYAPGSTLEGFAKDLFNAWGVGDARRNDGILILVALEDREVRIQLGRAYPPVYDGRAQRVIDAMMLPEFRAEAYGAGLLAGVNGARDHVARPFREAAQVTETSGLPPVPDAGGFPWEIGAFLAIVAAVFGLKQRNRIADAVARRRPCPNCGAMGVEIVTRTTREPGETTAGERVISRHCPSCDWHQDRVQPLPSHSAHDSDGGRGGSSGGGGASGRW